MNMSGHVTAQRACLWRPMSYNVRAKVYSGERESCPLLACDSKYLSTLNKTYESRQKEPNVKSSRNNETEREVFRVSPHFLQSKLIFKFRWTGLTITIFTVKMPQGSYKRTKYAVNLPLYCVQLYGFVPGTRLPRWPARERGFFPKPRGNNALLVTRLPLRSLSCFTLVFGLHFTYSNYFLWLLFLLRNALYITE